jgi:hypothetical protein
MTMLRHRLSRRPHDDEGSIILALFAIMVISSLTLMVAATVITGQKQTVADQRFEQALEVAEVGLSQMNSLIENNPGLVAFDPMSGTTDDGGSYSVSATKTNYTWTVTAVGKSKGGKTRTVSNLVSVAPLFNMAAFGKVQATFQGGNGADSYNSNLNNDICVSNDTYNTTPSSNYVDPGLATNADSNKTNVQMCQPTKFGTVGTNGELFLKGGVADRVDMAQIYNAKENILDPLPNATGFCKGETSTCNLYTSSPQRLTYTREPIPFPAIKSCTFPAGNNAVASNGGGTFGGRAYNLSDVVLDGSSVFTGTASQPTILCVSGHLSIQAQHLVNFTMGTHGTLIPRPPASLLIFVTGSSNSGVTLGDHASVSAAIYAPNAAIECGPQGNVYGSVVANSINNAGGWNFHYDDALRDQMANAPVRISDWVEVR